jgi:hypothetical protein
MLTDLSRHGRNALATLGLCLACALPAQATLLWN